MAAQRISLNKQPVRCVQAGEHDTDLPFLLPCNSYTFNETR